MFSTLALISLTIHHKLFNEALMICHALLQNGKQQYCYSRKYVWSPQYANRQCIFFPLLFVDCCVGQITVDVTYKLTIWNHLATLLQSCKVVVRRLYFANITCRVLRSTVQLLDAEFWWNRCIIIIVFSRKDVTSKNSVYSCNIGRGLKVT